MSDNSTVGNNAADLTPSAAGDRNNNSAVTGNASHSPLSIGTSSAAAGPPDPPAPAVPGYDYRVTPSGQVYDVSGRQVYSASVTSALNWALGQSGKVTYLPAGTYNLTGNVDFASNATLVGDGTSTILSAATNVVLRASNVDHVTMRSFQFTGTIEILLEASSGIHGHHLLEDITAYHVKVGSENDAQFMTYVRGTAVLDDVRYVRCQAIEGDLIGFWNDGDFQYQGWAKNVYYEECESSRNGLTGARYNDWVVGFDLAEGVNVDNVTLVRCQADYNWEDGFHLENDPIHRNVSLMDCTASYNGQKPGDYISEGGQKGPLFGAGYFMGAYSKQDSVSLSNSTGEGNPLGLVRYDRAA